MVADMNSEGKEGLASFKDSNILYCFQSSWSPVGDLPIEAIFVFFCSVDTRYENLRLQAADRRHKLLDALSLHQLNRDAYIVDSWINEKVGGTECDWGD